MHEAWTSFDLGSLASLVTSGSRGWAEFYAAEGAAFLRITNLSRSTIRPDLTDLKRVRLDSAQREGSRTRILAGDLMISITADLGIVGVAPDLGEAYVNQHIALVRMNGDVLPEFVGYYLAGPGQAQFARFNDAGAKAGLNLGSIRSLSVPVPTLREQRKIAAILSSVDDAIEDTQAVIDQLQVVKKAMMAELLTRGLPGRHTKFKMTEIGEIPSSWHVEPCGDLFEVQLGKMMSADARAGSDQFPYLRNENVYWHRLELSDVASMHFDPRERKKFRLRAGDLLACEGRHIGRCAVWNNELDECYYQKALHRIRRKSDVITTSYMQYFMMLRFRFMDDLVAEANTTSTIPHLPLQKLVALPVWFPPREEQEQILEGLTSVSGREDIERRSLAALTETKAALMSVLLTGELRVTPDDEAPA